MENDIFTEIEDTKRLIEDNRNVLYKLQETSHSEIPIRIQAVIRDRTILVKSLECYLDILENTVSVRARQKSREKSSV